MNADLQACVEFLQRLIRTPGLPGQEGETARLVQQQMQRLGYADVRIDEAGNVLGRVRGRGAAPPVIFNTHLDHVDVGDHGAWPHPPFGGEIHDGSVWGRGAVDIKGPLAAQVHGVARLLGEDPPPGDVWVTAVVQEEVGGVGARHLLEHLRAPLVVIGEPSGNSLRRGHRGRSELIVHVVGRSAHASVPHNGVNPWQVLARFLLRLPELEMPTHPELGASTVAPTLIRTDQTSGNVIPGELWLTCDWRHVPGESARQAQAKLAATLRDALVAGATGEVTIPAHERVTWTGLRAQIAGNNPAYILAAEHPAVVAAAEALEPVLGARPEPGTWRFATDGGHFSQAGMACVGFGPGDELLAHTVEEHLPIAQLEVALAGNEALARSLAVGAVRHGLAS